MSLLPRRLGWGRVLAGFGEKPKNRRSVREMRAVSAGGVFGGVGENTNWVVRSAGKETWNEAYKPSKWFSFQGKEKPGFIPVIIPRTKLAPRAAGF